MKSIRRKLMSAFFTKFGRFFFYFLTLKVKHNIRTLLVNITYAPILHFFGALVSKQVRIADNILIMFI